ncbi:hypothetical protein QQS21_012614 [Conoideocrella luteorostrata]|uniref:Uncharacterized protein n=1 Tax=Conoideocrella luteorostrata TaxID=1105319 RepID=A0AAJ0CAU4_9HYPO|nr:hypothetical protein QQS21_012614 [Conoideocrella luteorostrata]
MFSNQPPRAHQPIILPPLTPSELLEHLVAKTTYPTTVVIGWPRDIFVNALVQDVKQKLAPRAEEEEEEEGEEEKEEQAAESVSEKQQQQQHTLLQATLMQTAISRHINIVFTPTVTHLRAYLATFSAAQTRVPAPPKTVSLSKPPHLFVYGLLELHRDGMEWSAQGLSISTAMFVESAWRDAFMAVIVEPRRTDEAEELEQSLQEKLPVLTGTPIKDDGSWGGPTVAVSRVVGRWFRMDAKAKDS